jgi:hypothetical protein
MAATKGTPKSKGANMKGKTAATAKGKKAGAGLKTRGAGS